MHCPEQWYFIEKKTSPSTNTELKELAQRGAPEGTVLTARQQTAGRGRLGRTFFSPPDTGLYLSVLLCPTEAPEEITRLTPTAAVAAARAIRRVCNAETGIKWVNDLLLDGKKVCGILTEGIFDPETGKLQYAVCGLGFNLFPPQEGFPPDIAELAGSILQKKDPAVRERLTRVFPEELGNCLRMPFSDILEEYRRRSVLTGKTVFSPNNAFPGDAAVLGIADNGGLHLKRSDGTEFILTTGEASIRISD